MTDLDDEAQAKIEEMMYNDRQKKLGLPTAKEQVCQIYNHCNKCFLACLCRRKSRAIVIAIVVMQKL